MTVSPSLLAPSFFSVHGADFISNTGAERFPNRSAMSGVRSQRSWVSNGWTIARFPNRKVKSSCFFWNSPTVPPRRKRLERSWPKMSLIITLCRSTSRSFLINGSAIGDDLVIAKIAEKKQQRNKTDWRILLKEIKCVEILAKITVGLRLEDSKITKNSDKNWSFSEN